MPRASYSAARALRRRRLRRAAKGYRAGRSKLTRTMMVAVLRAGQHAYIDRRKRKRDFRTLWITRITAACRARGVSYSRFMNGIKKASIALNRKMLSELAIADEAAFDKIVDMTK
ncbi:MAG: 50S ribosomal protein L20 [Planctomycetota bacterium]